jgi:hypothetical protein
MNTTSLLNDLLKVKIHVHLYEYNNQRDIEFPSTEFLNVFKKVEEFLGIDHEFKTMEEIHQINLIMAFHRELRRSYSVACANELIKYHKEKGCIPETPYLLEFIEQMRKRAPGTYTEAVEILNGYNPSILGETRVPMRAYTPEEHAGQCCRVLTRNYMDH